MDILSLIITALIVAVLICAMSFITWLGFDRGNPGLKQWAIGFLLYSIALGFALSGLGKGLYSIHQAPILALTTLANWMQYRGFRLFLAHDSKAAKPVRLPFIVLIGIAFSGLSFLLRLSLVTYGIQDLLTLGCLGLILSCFFRRHRPISRPIEYSILAFLTGAAIVLVLASIWFFINQGDHPGSMMMASRTWFIGPRQWIGGMAFLAIIESQLVSGALLEDKAQALAKTEVDKRKLSDLNAELMILQRDILGTMASAFENRTAETADHVDRVAELCKKILVRLGYPQDQARWIADASRLHDIGKIGIPDAILKSSATLSEADRNEMKKHTLLGYKILSQSSNAFFRLAAKIALEHHEHWDGRGYPYGLKEKAICEEARIVAIADTFDALVSQRSYKAPWSRRDAIDWIRGQAGIMFDPEIVNVFLEELQTCLPATARDAGLV